MRKWTVWILSLWIAVLSLAGCAQQGADEGASANPPPTTNPMGQPSTPDTAGAQAEERKAGGY